MSSFSGPDVFEEADELKARPMTIESNISSSSEHKSDKHHKTSSSASLAHKASVLPPDAALTIAQQRLSTEFVSPFGLQPITAATVVIYNAPAPEKEKEDDVTEDFIKEFNDRRGNAENVSKAWRLMKKTRILAGLEASSAPHIDIPSARRNFLLLARLNHQELNMSALHNLIEVLQKDEIKPDTAFDLMTLAIYLMKQMDRELMQTQLVDEQVRICQAYGIVAELIQRHYARKHLGGITFELKSQLIQTARTLEDLNTHGDPRLHFAVEYALEGVKRLRDDRKELFELGEKLFHLVVAAASVYAKDMQNFSAEIEKVYQGLDIRVTNVWYDASLIFNELSKKGDKDMGQLTIMQGLVKEKAKEMDWKFLYNAIEKFGNIAINGSTHSIRKAAFSGHKVVNENYPGILDFIAFQDFYRKPSFKPIIHFKVPVIKNNNIIIRQLCIKTLISIASQSVDKSIRKKAKAALLNRLGREDDAVILQNIKDFVPDSISEQKEWLNETGKYVFKVPEKENRIEETSKEPSGPIQKIATQVFTSLPLVYNPSIFAQQRRKSLDPMQSFVGSIRLKNKDPAPLPHAEVLDSTENSPPASPRTVPKAPNKTIFLLGKCLEIDPQIIQNEFELSNDIHPHGDSELHITTDGMKKLIHLMEKRKDIKALNFSHCEVDKEGLILLAGKINNFNVRIIHLPSGLSHTVAKKMAEAFENNFELEIVPKSQQDYLVYGAALVKKGLLNDAIHCYLKGFSNFQDNAADHSLKAKFYYKLGQVEIMNGSMLEAELALRQSLKLKPDSFRVNFEIARLYHGLKKFAEGLVYVEKALQIQPKNQKATELAAQLRKEKVHSLS